ncbi:hypothetical protein GF377_07785 [candidate division GN15 bacterium]|nr:hypothetical protein [candidate division GN15 bacterium]
MLSEYDSTDWSADFVYLYGVPIARVWAENETVELTTVTHYDISWYHLDHLGTPQVLTDSNQTVRWSAQYYPFGELASEQVSTVNNQRFPGQYDDHSTDTYYNMYRHYHPSLGRYLTPDPIGLAGLSITLPGLGGNGRAREARPSPATGLSAGRESAAAKPPSQTPS